MTTDLAPWERPDDLTVDLFAGPGGWDEGARMVDLPGRIIGVEWDEAACATAEAAGHPRHRGDLSMLAVDHFGPFRGLIASPPCQAWSTAGKGLGKLDQPRILAHLDRIREAGRWLHYSREGWHDDRSPLVLEPVRWALLGRPEWIACEQVPAVLPFWQAFGAVLNDHGYEVATGKLTAEQYGVPQTRQRAILVATRTGSVASLPAPTHQAYTKRKPFDPESPLPRWVSMAEALDWGMTERPYVTVAAGTKSGGSDPMALGGTGARRTVLGERDADRWVQRSNYSGPGTSGATAAERGRTERDLDEPSVTMTGKAAQWAMRASHQPNSAVRSVDEPAPTIIGGHDTANRVWVGAKFGNQDNSAVRSVDEPAATIRYSQRGNALDWVHDRPAPTVVGSRRSTDGMLIGRQLGDDSRRDSGGKSGDVGLGSTHLAAVRVSVDEAARLQTFPYGYPWQGKKTKQYEQVGNAIPPLLAAAILGNLHNIPAWRDVCMSMRPEAVPERTAA